MNACLVAGTRGALDFVEIPSHVMEYWARDYRVVKEWAIDENGEYHLSHGVLGQGLQGGEGMGDRRER